mmetsp:Transcript_57500/g.125978  ORF Transcript_57500/g.125978 Transcript_57500/m.125978 type:complete len:206 (-) Transcript_57500:54-671(-)
MVAPIPVGSTCKEAMKPVVMAVQPAGTFTVFAQSLTAAAIMVAMRTMFRKPPLKATVHAPRFSGVERSAQASGMLLNRRMAAMVRKMSCPLSRKQFTPFTGSSISPSSFTNPSLATSKRRKSARPADWWPLWSCQAPTTPATTSEAPRAALAARDRRERGWDWDWGTLSSITSSISSSGGVNIIVASDCAILFPFRLLSCQSKQI